MERHVFRGRLGGSDSFLEQQRRWLLFTPPSDLNFRNALEGASLGLLEQVLTVIPVAGNKTRRQVIERRIRKLKLSRQP